MKARIVNDVAVDVSDNPGRDFAPGLAAQFENVPDDVRPQWHRVREIVDGLLTANKIWVSPLTYIEEYEPGLFRYAERTVVPPPPPKPVVPKQVTRRQAKQALHLAGLMNAVDNALNGIPNQTQKALMRIEWDDSLVFERDRPQLIALATQIGLTSEQLDDLFITAAALP